MNVNVWYFFLRICSQEILVGSCYFIQKNFCSRNLALAKSNFNNCASSSSLGFLMVFNLPLE